MTQTTVVSRFRCGANTKLPSFIGGVYSFSVNTCVNHNNTFGRVCGFLREIIIELAFAGFRIVLFGFDYKWDTIFVSAGAINEDKSIAVCFATKSYISQHWPHVLLIYVIRDIVSLHFNLLFMFDFEIEIRQSLTLQCRCDATWNKKRHQLLMSLSPFNHFVGSVLVFPFFSSFNPIRLWTFA